MTQPKLNKTSLSLEQKNLKNYKKYLPSLELKRKKLLSERGIVAGLIAQLKEKEKELVVHVENQLPMVNENMDDLSQYIKVKQFDLQEENIVGVKLPVLKSIQFMVLDYPYLNTPHWFEPLMHRVAEFLEIRLRLKLAFSRLQLLDKAIQTVTQRKNLFEKVLIPNALNHIRLIQIFLSDNERAAVVRSKIAKKKRQLL
ncbi:V-type ATP synthase subunit D [Legionella saoudiensis]|uniref:V-type ATP synthase subunit D n=1 Tax=Legionella saoudiensis TaxID=1750561 RepID=UPI000730EC89|nr:V-type ATP synthase subunit D [Legionella saoudiensis]